MANKEQKTLFGEGSVDNWRNEWKNMPEFIQKNKQPIQQIVVSFEKEEDIEIFAKVTGYKITKKTKSIWFPFKKKDKPREFAYIDTDE